MGVDKFSQPRREETSGHVNPQDLQLNTHYHISTHGYLGSAISIELNDSVIPEGTMNGHSADVPPLQIGPTSTNRLVGLIN